MGGCIAGRTYAAYAERVSSLYGRVYRDGEQYIYLENGFLPVWEGVSKNDFFFYRSDMFPPCMGGCIETESGISSKNESFLPVWEGVSFVRITENKKRSFLPVWEGVSK